MSFARCTYCSPFGLERWVCAVVLDQPLLPAHPNTLGTPAPPRPGPAERIAINLAPPLLRLIREAKYLDQLGFSVPEVGAGGFEWV